MQDQRYAVIGAGPSGLSAARALQKAGLAFDGYEASRGVGGLWDIENPRSTMYESAHLISSRTTTEFSRVPDGFGPPTTRATARSSGTSATSRTASA